MARRRRHTPEQIVRKLREADRLLGEGSDRPSPREPDTGLCGQQVAVCVA